MQNGLYSVEFKTQIGPGHGVVMLLNGNLTGGDSMMYYVGTYTNEGSSFKATLKSKSHAHPPGMRSVFGVDPITISLSGTFTDTEVTGHGTAAEAPGANFTVKLRLLAVGA